MDINIDELKQLLWDATNYGRQFFEDEFTSEIARNRGRIKGFSVRTEDKTGSCHIFQKGNSPYTFTDFGVSNKGLNAIDYVQQRDNCTFWEAIKTLFSQYGLPLPNGAKIEPKVEFSADVTEDEGFWQVNFRKYFKNTKILKRLFPFYTENLLSEYNFKEIESYEMVDLNKKGNKYQKKTTATDDFPIFGYDKGDFVKIYQPFAPKGDDFIHKHSFVGEKSGNRIIYGWDRIFDKVDFEEIRDLNILLKEASGEVRKELLKKLEYLRLDTVIIATGGTDGINIASLGYDVIWFNSETEVINSEEAYKLSLIAKNIYYVPDLDETGVKQAVQVAETNLDIKIVWLPKDLLAQNKKDFADWLRREKNAGLEVLSAVFRKMLGQALNFRFWDFSERGAVQLNATKILHFLQLKNFYTYKTPYINFETQKEEQGYFVQLKNNRIDKVLPSDMRRFMLEWIDKKFIDTSVRNKIITAPIFNQTQLKMLPFFEYKKNHCGRGFQWYFFENKAVKVNKDGIAVINFSQKLNINMWGEDCVKHNFEIEKPFFETYTDDFGRPRINILRNESAYFKVLINTSRVYWEKDADATGKDLNPFGISSKNLTDEENYMQELHLMNKMYCVGYLLHKYKIKSEAYLVLGVDFKMGSSVKGSYGGTGKTFLQESLSSLLNIVQTDGESYRNNNFPFDGVTPKTNFVIIDDLAMYQKMRPFYTLVTSNFVANQKGGVIYNMPFDDSPKVGATTNFAPEDLSSGSSQRRLLIYHNSDYYHQKTEDNNYAFSRKISDDFGGEDIMRGDYSTEKWNADYNFMMQCLQFYFAQKEPIIAPIDTLLQKNYLMKIGDSFVSFFNEYFSDSLMLNNWVESSTFIVDAKEVMGKKFQSAQDVKKKLIDYCKAHGWGFTELKRKNHSYNSVNHFFINTENKTEMPLEDETETKEEAEQTNLIQGLTTDIPY